MICNGNRVVTFDGRLRGTVRDMDEHDPRWVFVDFGRHGCEWIHVRELKRCDPK